MAKVNIKRMVASVTTKALPAAAGGAASLAMNKIVPASVNPKVRGIGKILLGAVLPEISPRTKMLEPFGMGFAGQAGAELATELIPAIAGPDEIEGVGAQDEYVIDDDFVSGAEDGPQVGAEDGPQVGDGSEFDQED